MNAEIEAYRALHGSPSGDGRRRARLKLIAGLIGTRFDDLVERDAVRSRQRMLSAAMPSLLELARGLDGGRGKQDSSALLEERGCRSEFRRRLRAAFGA